LNNGKDEKTRRKFTSEFDVCIKLSSGDCGQGFVCVYGAGMVSGLSFGCAYLFLNFY